MTPATHRGATRIVVDTNVLVSAAHDDLSAGRKITDACIRGELTVVVSPALRSEYERILREKVSIRGFAAHVRDFLTRAETVTPQSVPRVVRDDPEDDKVIAAATAGRADAIVTSDLHLLELDPHGTIRILRPEVFDRQRREERGGSWQDLAHLTGLTP